MSRRNSGYFVSHPVKQIVSILSNHACRSITMRHKQQAKAPLKSCSCRSHWHLLECTIASFAVSIP